MFVDSRFDYLSRVRYYAATAATPLQFMANLPSQASEAAANLFRSHDDLLADNERLREELLMQQYQLQKLEHLVAENQRLNELLKSSTIVNEEVMRAQLTGESPDPYVKRILINKGSRDGVFIGQPVLDASGLMGQVVEVEPLSSWVLLITDPQHSTPVQINRNGVRAIASGTRDTLHQLTLNNVPNTEDVKVGDVLVTSGIGGRFPPGYPVGVVSSVRQDPAQPFADVLVTPTAQINRSRNLLLVFVTEQPAPPAAAVEPPAPVPDATAPPVATDPNSAPASETTPQSTPEVVPEPAPETAPEAAPAPAPLQQGNGDGE
jgi:rod shape-determining protein MreC